MPILVAYASRHGATEETAVRIARRLADEGAAVECRHVEGVESIAGYDAVVFGAPVYDQAWPPEADAFVAEHRDELSATTLWLFSVGSFGDTKSLIGPLTHNEPRGITELRADLGPREYRVFQGVVQKHQWPLWSRIFFHAFGGRFGDHRDWATVDAWARRISAEFADDARPSTPDRREPVTKPSPEEAG
ncbi:MAG TPA: flavodoxin domain-containing protein [Gaiellaceae bacterium]|nr:flavodoxin domain-containing protein [Gaiellaceae bacterium]